MLSTPPEQSTLSLLPGNCDHIETAQHPSSLSHEAYTAPIACVPSAAVHVLCSTGERAAEQPTFVGNAAG